MFIALSVRRAAPLAPYSSPSGIISLTFKASLISIVSFEGSQFMGKSDNTRSFIVSGLPAIIANIEKLPLLQID